MQTLHGRWPVPFLVCGRQRCTVHTYQFFNADVQNAVAPIIESILIDKLSVRYQYHKGMVSSLELNGRLRIGSIELALLYKNKSFGDGKGSDWAFAAKADYIRLAGLRDRRCCQSRNSTKFHQAQYEIAAER